IKGNNMFVKYYDKNSINEIELSSFKDNERFVLSLGGIDSIYYNFPSNFQNSVDIIVTSPPYVYAQEYIRSSKLELYWLGEINDSKASKLAKNEIGHRKFVDLDKISKEIDHIKSYKLTKEKLLGLEKEKYGKNGKYTPQIINYFYDMYSIIKNMRKPLKKDGIFAFFIGNPTVLGIQVECWKIFYEFFLDLGYEILEYGYDPIVSRALLRGRNNASPNGMEYEWLIIAKNRF
ncbi:MAG: hypothetical protein ACFFCS_05150, partial [Candidatus Hodarchaeota archaeon]